MAYKVHLKHGNERGWGKGGADASVLGLAFLNSTVPVQNSSLIFLKDSMSYGSSKLSAIWLTGKSQKSSNICGP